MLRYLKSNVRAIRRCYLLSVFYKIDGHNQREKQNDDDKSRINVLQVHPEARRGIQTKIGVHHEWKTSMYYLNTYNVLTLALTTFQRSDSESQAC